jgi:hypothetical protein
MLGLMLKNNENEGNLVVKDGIDTRELEKDIAEFIVKDD